MNKKKIDKRIKIISVLILLVILLTVRTLIFGRDTTSLERITTDTFQTIEYYLFTKPVEYIKDLYNEVVEIKDVYNENKTLKKQLNNYALAETKISVLTDEINQLKEQLNLDCLPTEYNVKTTYVVNRNPDTWSNNVLINLGKENDVDVNMAVIDQYGLIGYVSSVNQVTSEVTLLTSEKLSKQIPVKIKDTEGTECYGLLVDYDVELECYEVDMFVTSEFDKDSEIYTSGLGGDIPEGILVGTLSSVSESNNMLNPTLLVKPSANYETISYVSVVQRGDQNE